MGLLMGSALHDSTVKGSIMSYDEDSQVIDDEGFRSNVGIIVCNDKDKLLWARRVGQDAWQFPQGGMKKNESPEQALYRELEEEVGLVQANVEIIASTENWLHYRLPKRYIRHDLKPICIGQKQLWFLLRLTEEDRIVKLDSSDKPEFDNWKWVSYWHPLKEVVSFKRKVYRSALNEFAPLLKAGKG